MALVGIFKQKFEVAWVLVAWLTPLGPEPSSACKYRSCRQTHPVEIPFSKEQFQFKTLFIMKLFWGKNKPKTPLQLLEFSNMVFTPWVCFPLLDLGLPEPSLCYPANLLLLDGGEDPRDSLSWG